MVLTLPTCKLNICIIDVLVHLSDHPPILKLSPHPLQVFIFLRSPQLHTKLIAMLRRWVIDGRAVVIYLHEKCLIRG